MHALFHCIQTLQKDSIGSGKPPSGEQPSTKDSTHSRTTENSYLDHKPSTTSLSLSYTSDTKGYEGSRIMRIHCHDDYCIDLIDACTTVYHASPNQPDIVLLIYRSIGARYSDCGHHYEQCGSSLHQR